MSNESIKGRGVGSLLCAIAALVALVTGVLFLMTQATAAPLGHTGVMPGVVLLAGVVVAVALWLVPVRFGALVQAIVYGYGLYLSVTQLYLVFADVINQVTYAGGNPGLCVLYMAGAFASCLLCVVACFFESPVTAEQRARSKRMVPVAAVLVIACVVGVGALLASGQGSTSESGSTSGSSSALTMNEADNEYASKSIDDLVATPWDEWVAKEANGEVAYFFEGQYTEGFGTTVDPACLDLYLCTDGSLYGSLSGPTTSVAPTSTYYYGYWYTTNASGEDDFVIHLTGSRAADGTVRAIDSSTGEDTDIHIFDTDRDDYGWEASFSLGLYGGMMTRNMNLYGQQYAPAQSVTIDSSALGTFYTGDEFNPAALAVTVTRANGKSETIWGGRLNYTGYDSDSAGTKEVTGSFLGATATFDVTVDDLDADTYAGTYGLVVDKAVTETPVTMTVDHSHKTVTVANSDGTASIQGTIVSEGEGTITMSLNGSDPFDATVTDSEISIPAHQEVVAGYGSSATYDVSAYTLSLSE